MKSDCFVPTRNSQRLEELVAELLGPSLGIELAVVLGPYGRGKTFAAERIVTQNPNAVYLYYEPRYSLPALIREIGFILGGVRHRTQEDSVAVIRDELSRHRRVILVDEADQMSLKSLNQLRAFHDLHHVPIVLCGEDSLYRKMNREGRLTRRVREVLKFEPVAQGDVVYYYKKALSLGMEPAHAKALLVHAKGDFGKVVLDAARVERIMQASGLKSIQTAVIDEVCK